MYLSATTHTLEVVADAAPATTQPQYHISYNDHTSSGMTLPQTSTEGNLNGSTTVTALSAPAASTTRQVAYMTVYNADTATRIITVKKDISGTEYIVIKASLVAGATLEYSRENGWTIISQSTQPSHIITEFTGNGTWTKPANLKAAVICCVGAGGGGGGGRRDAAGTNRFGGGGGGGGALVWSYFPESSLAASYAVTIGTAGTSGAAATADTTNGGNGGVGGDTSFGSLIIAKGGNGGTGGSGSSGSAGTFGAASGCTPSYGPFAMNGVSGSAGTTNAQASSPASGYTGAAACAGGCGGSGINSSNASNTSSNVGGAIWNNGVNISGPATGSNGSNNQARTFFWNTSLIPANGLGTGGSGGNVNSVTGGNGGSYGAGGGGGSGVLNGTNSGAGGTGGGGLCIVLEIY